MNDKKEQCGMQADWPGIVIGPDFTLQADREGLDTSITSDDLVEAKQKAFEEGGQHTFQFFIPNDGSKHRMDFVEDLGDSMVFVGQGYDPYNHVGHYIVADIIGVTI